MEKDILTIKDVDVLLSLLRVEIKREESLVGMGQVFVSISDEYLADCGLEGRLLKLRYFLTD